jgi:hypothetical protein
MQPGFWQAYVVRSYKEYVNSNNIIQTNMVKRFIIKKDIEDLIFLNDNKLGIIDKCSRKRGTRSSLMYE